MTYGAIGGAPGQSLGPVEPKQGEFFDRNELPKRFWRTQWSEEEIEAVSSGGASLFG
jgi:small subunit ribosomal protein YMR-31